MSDFIIKQVSNQIGKHLGGASGLGASFGSGVATGVYGAYLTASEFIHLKNQLDQGNAKASDVISATVALETILLGAGLVAGSPGIVLAGVVVAAAGAWVAYDRNESAIDATYSQLVDDWSKGIDVWESLSRAYDTWNHLKDPRTIGSTINDYFRDAKRRPERDPLAIDLDGDGIETVGVIGSQAPIQFDHDADGVKTGTGWLKGDDAWLVLDRNGNGIVDSGRELFGVDTMITTNQYNVSTGSWQTVTRSAYNGFEALRSLDTYSDSVFDQNDADFSKVKLWQDFNQDGISQANELSTLANKGITKINLIPSGNVTTLGNGNSVAGVAEVVRSSGTTTIDSVLLASTANNLNLASNPFYRTFDPIPLVDAARGLPDMQGSGWARDLREAMSQDNVESAALVDVVSRFAAGETRTEQMSVIDELLQDWAASTSKFSQLGLINPVQETVIGESPNPNGGILQTLQVTTMDPAQIAQLNLASVLYPAVQVGFVEAEYTLKSNNPLVADSFTVDGFEVLRQLAVVEQFNGQRYLDRTTSRVIGAPSGGGSGGGGGGGGSGGGVPPTGPDVRYAITLFEENVAAIKASYQALKESVYGALVVQTRLQPYLDAIQLIIDDEGFRFDSVALQAKLTQTYLAEPVKGLSDLIELNRYTSSTLTGVGFDGVAMLREWVESIPADSPLQALLVDLNIYQKPNQWSNLTDEADIYIGGQNKGSVSAGEGNDILDGGDGDEIFSGGIGQDTLRGRIGHDTLWGDVGDDVLYGGQNRDRLHGDDGDDTLDGGGGNDYMVGGNGSDSYFFGMGDGRDTIGNGDSDAEGTQPDTLFLKEGVNPLDVTLRRSGSDLIIAVGGGGDQLIVTQHFAQEGVTNNRLDEIRFSDGTSWLVDEIKARAFLGTALHDTITGHATNDLINGGWGRDSLFGGAGDDILDGGVGNDWLSGGAGADTYHFGRGSGQDTINNYDSDALGVKEDTLQLGAGIVESDITMTRVNDDLVIGLVDAKDRMTIQSYFYQNGSSDAVENIRFESGAVLGLSAVKSLMLASTGNADSIVGYGSSSVINGGDGRDTIVGGRSADILEGGAGDDSILGDAGNDVLDGGAGDDTLDGGTGADTYRFGRGSGSDFLIMDGGGASEDTLEFHADVRPEDVALSVDGYSLRLQIKGTNDVISVYGYAYEPLKAIRFGDGTSWDAAFVKTSALAPTDGSDYIFDYWGNSSLRGGSGNDTLQGQDYLSDEMFGDDGNDLLRGAGAADQLSGGDGDDEVVGDAGDDVLNGDAGADRLLGDQGDDTLDGGAGSDYLWGGSGADTYMFGRGSGRDFVFNQDSNPVGDEADTIWINAGILPSDVMLTRSAHSLVIRLKGPYDDRLEVVNYFYQSNPNMPTVVENIRFDNGVNWSVSDVNSMLVAEPENLTLAGTSSGESLTGGLGYDKLYGFAGDDVLDGGGSDDFLEGGLGNDVYVFGRGSGRDTIHNADESVGKLDVVQLSAGIVQDDIDVRRSGMDLEISIKGLSDALKVLYFFDDADGSRNQVEQIKFFDGSIWGVDAIKEKVLVPSDQDDVLHSDGGLDPVLGGLGDDSLYGQQGDDILAGGGGFDSLVGEGGNDQLDGGAQNDSLDGGNGLDVLRGGDGDDVLFGGGDADVISGGPGNDLLNGGSGVDRYQFSRGFGADTINADSDGVNVIEFDGSIVGSDVVLRKIEDGYSKYLLVSVGGSSGSIKINDYFTYRESENYKIEFSDGVVWDHSSIKALTMLGSGGDDDLVGYSLGDDMSGGAGEDDIYGREGADFLSGGAGADYLQGEDGDDTLNGGAGDDILIGGAGNDVYVFSLGSGYDRISDRKGVDTNVVEFGAGIGLGDVFLSHEENSSLKISIKGGRDVLEVSGYFKNSAAAGYQVDQLKFSDQTILDVASVMAQVLQYTNGDDSIRGFDSNDVLSGGVGADTLLGGAGSDTLDGGAGDDLLNGQAGQDVYMFGRGSGMDTIGESPSDSSGRDVVRLAAGVSAADLSFATVGNDLILSIIGTRDSLRYVDYRSSYSSTQVHRLDRVEFADGTTWDNAALNAKLLYARGDGGTVTGYASDDRVFGSEEDDVLNGAKGNDSLYGCIGHDTLRGDEGHDVLFGGRMGDQLWGGVGDDALNGDEGADYLYGESGNDSLNGGSGTDMLVGGIGADTYQFFIGSGNDTISESDAVIANIDTIDLAIKSNELTAIERKGDNLVLSYGTGDSITVVNQFLSNANEIEEIKFSDGVTWDEVAIKDRVITNGDSLSNTIVGYGDGPNRIYGLGGNDVITGGAMNDLLDGGDGRDTLTGGNGDDHYKVTLTPNGSGVDQPDLVVEHNGLAGGNDTVTVTGASYTLPENLENLVMTGKVGFGTMPGKSGKHGVGNNAANQIFGFIEDDTLEGLGGNDTLFGDTGNDTLDGGLGVDSLVGGTGDDTYILKPEFDAQGAYIGFDTIEESTGVEGGTDTVDSSVDAYTLAPGLENLVLHTLTGFGNDLGNVITGDQQNNRMVGHGGNDTLSGGLGNDTLEGGAGHDTLDGGQDHDSLVGGAGDDAYRWGGGAGNDRINDTSGNDHVELSAEVSASQIWLTQTGNDLVVKLLGAQDTLTIESWFASADARVESFKLANGQTLDHSKVAALVDAMSKFSPAANADALQADPTYAPINALIASSWAG